MSAGYRQIPKYVPAKFVPDGIKGGLTIRKGRRVGIFAGWGVGKSTLMGMIAKPGRWKSNQASPISKLEKMPMKHCRWQSYIAKYP